MVRPLKFSRYLCVALCWLTISTGLSAAEFDKAAIPTAAQQKEAAADLEEVFKLSSATTKAKKEEVVPSLVEFADDAVKTKDFAQLYVILQATFPLVRDTGDFATFAKAMELLNDNFAVDSRKEWSTGLRDFLKGCDSAADYEAIVDQSLPIVERLSQANQLYEAWDVLTAVEDHAKRIKPAPAKIQPAFDEAKEAVRERGVAYKAQTEAAKKLATDPDDPQANYDVGAWLAVFENDWAAALPKLAKGSNPEWKAAAEAELNVALVTDDQAKMAGLWWDIAGGINAESTTKEALQKHVLDWYTRVVARIANPLLKTVVERRIEELKPRNAAPAVNLAPLVGAPPANQVDKQLPIGEMIDLLQMIQLPDHAIEGSWQMINGSLVCGASSDARVMAPVVLSRNYEVRLDFTRNAGSEAINLVCPIGGTTFVIQVSGWGGKYAGMYLIDGKLPPDIKDRGAVISPGSLENGKPYTLQVNLQESRGTATINAALNGKQFVSWRGAVNRLSCWEMNALPSPRSVGVLVHSSTATIHGFGVILTRGGEGYRLGDDWTNPLDVVANAPPKTIAKECVTWKGRQYFVAPKPSTHSDAQRLAAMLQGRLLTVSSEAENDFVFQMGKGRSMWTAAWRVPSSNTWLDERNRPLRMFKWDRGEPNNNRGRQLRIRTAGVNPNWWDMNPWDQAYACIEWGEEYP